MAYDFGSSNAGDVAHATQVKDSAAVPGRRSAAAELYESHSASSADRSKPGSRGSSPALFADSVEWEDIHGDDPMQEGAEQPADEEADVGPADEEGELDADSEVDDEEAVADPHELAAGTSEAARAPAAGAANGPTGGSAETATSGRSGDDPRAPRAPTAHVSRAGGETYHVNRSYRDGPYGGTAKYDVRVTAKDITVTVGIRLKPDPGVSRRQVAQVKSASQAIFKQKYDQRFKLTEIPYKPRPLRMRVRFSHRTPHHDVALHKGGGRDNAANWYVKSDGTTRAHEIGHLLGLKDEYADSASPKRKVYTDNSLMGNYYAEGRKTAELKKRHGKVFAGDISRASGRKFYISS